jgi:hypothetical protein
MQGEWTGELVGPDVWVACRELILAGSVFAFLAEHREQLFRASRLIRGFGVRFLAMRLHRQLLAPDHSTPTATGCLFSVGRVFAEPSQNGQKCLGLALP